MVASCVLKCRWICTSTTSCVQNWFKVVDSSCCFVRFSVHCFRVTLFINRSPIKLIQLHLELRWRIYLWYFRFKHFLMIKIFMNWAVFVWAVCYVTPLYTFNIIGLENNKPFSDFSWKVPQKFVLQNFLLVWHWLHHIVFERYQIYSWCHTKRRVGRALPSNPSIGMTTTLDVKIRICGMWLSI